MSRDVSPLSYSPLKPMLYPNNGNGCLNTSASQELDHYFNSEAMTHRRKGNGWNSTLNSESYMTRSEMPAYRDRSAEPTTLAYAYPPDRGYSSGSVSERHPYQYSHFHREPERVPSSHHSMEHDSKYGFKRHSIGSGYSNGFSSYDNQRDWPSWRMDSTSQMAPSNSSYDEPRRRPPHPDYNPPGPERPLNYDNQKETSSYWESESPQASSSWNPSGHEPSKWYPKPVSIPKTLRLLRPQPEPSYPWKRSIHDDHDRKLSSFDNRAIIPMLERRRISYDNYNPDPRRNDNLLLAQPLSDYPNRRSQQIPIPQPLPQPSVRFSQRERYHDIYRPPDNSNQRWTPSTYTPKRRPLHRISARISARPRKSPSPSESSSETSRSRSRQSHRRSRSRSRSSGPSNSRHDGGHSQSQIHHSLPSISNGLSEIPRNKSNGNMSPSKGESGPSRVNLLKPSSTSNYGNGSKITQRRERRSSSASSNNSESSIRSSVNSDDRSRPNEVITESSGQCDHPNLVSPSDSPTGPTIPPTQQESFFPLQSQVPLSFPSIEDNLELPGMRFNKNGVLKSDINAVSNTQVEVAKLETSQPNVACDVPTRTLNEMGDQSCDHVPQSQADEEMYFEDSRSSSPRVESQVIFAPLREELNSDDRMEISSNKGLDMTTPDDDVLSMTESENSIPNSPKIINTKALYQEVPVVPSTQVQTESSPLTDFAPLSTPPVIHIVEETANIEVIAPAAEEHAQPAQPESDLGSALRQFVAKSIDRQAFPVETRYDYVFEANLALKDASIMRKQSSNEELIQEVIGDVRFQQRLENHPNVAQVLIEQLKKRSEDFTAKTNRLRTEYKALHMRWVTSCRKLDQNLASQTTEPPSPTFRASRHTAGFNDIVRSDLEMEQIIAALGNEDMTDPNVLAIRNTATIPDLVTSDFNNLNLDVLYLSDNGLVEDPIEYFDTYSSLGHWTEEEKDLFLEKYGTYPKQFDVIASFLPGKTPAQCIMFYYLHKKELLDFRAAVKKYGPKRKRGRKSGKGKGKGNALLADIMKPSRGQDGEEGRRQMQQFGGMAAINGQKILSRRSLLKGVQISGGTSNMDGGLSGLDAAKGDGDAKSWSESPEEVDDSAIVVDHRRTRSVKPTESIPEPDVVVEPTERPREKAKRPPGRPPKQHRQPARVETTSSATPVKTTSYVWTKAEEAQYLKLVKEHGRDIKKIAAGMPAKTELQCRNYFRKHREFERIAKEIEDKLAKSSRS